MSSFFDNFNNDPVSVAVKTNTVNEVVPAGQYAQVIVLCKGAGQFFIDDIVALESEQQTTMSSSSLQEDGGGKLATGSTSTSPAYAFTQAQLVISETYWVPSGTNLKVTAGARYTLTLYNKQGN